VPCCLDRDCLGEEGGHRLTRVLDVLLCEDVRREIGLCPFRRSAPARAGQLVAGRLSGRDLLPRAGAAYARRHVRLAAGGTA
jgi:hypothetical protein